MVPKAPAPEEREPLEDVALATHSIDSLFTSIHQPHSLPTDAARMEPLIEALISSSGILSVPLF